MYAGNVSERIKVTKTNITSILTEKNATVSVYSNLFKEQVSRGLYTTHGITPDAVTNGVIGDWIKKRKAETQDAIEKEYHRYVVNFVCYTCNNISLLVC